MGRTSELLAKKKNGTLPASTGTVTSATAVNPGSRTQNLLAKKGIAQAAVPSVSNNGPMPGAASSNVGQEPTEFSLPKLLGGAVVKGVDEFISGLTSTAAWLENATLGKLFPGTTDNSPIQALNDRVQQAKKTNQEYTAANVEAGGKAAEIVDKYGTATAAAIPQAGLAILTGGGSAAAQGTTASLQAASSAAQAGTGFLSTVKSALSSLAKDPQYWLSFASTAGNSYEQAKADGTSDAKASLYALGNGLMNAAVEVGGGIQKLPGELQNGTKAFKAWLDTMLDEGKEEVVQGVLERGLQNLIYQKENPLFSTEDESAIINPKTSAGEFAGGVVAGGLLGGGQALLNGLLPGVKTSENTKNRPITLKTDVTPTSPLSEQKTAPSAVNGAEAANENTAKSGTNLVLPTPGVNAPNPQNNSSVFIPGSGLENTVDGYGPNTVGSADVQGVGPESSVGAAPSDYGQNTVGAAEAQFKYQEAPTQNVNLNMFTDEELKAHPELRSKHQVYTNAQSRFDARTMLANEYESEVERLKEDPWGAAEQTESHIILTDLVAEARKTGDWSKAIEWTKLDSRKGATEIGQSLQVRRQYKNSAVKIAADSAEILEGDNIRRMKPEKKKAILDSIFEQGKALEDIADGDLGALISLIERNNEIRRTTGLFSKKTAKQMDWALNEVVKNYPETAEQFLRDVAVSQIRSISSDYQKLSPLEAVKNYRIMGMLSKASTVMRNLVSNNVFDPLESLSNDVGIIADGIMSIATGQRTTAVDKSWLSKAKRSGSLEGALKSYIQVGLDADVGESSSRYETGDNRTFKMTGNFLERLLSTWSKYENYALKTTDEFQKGGIAAETQRGIEQLQQSGKLAEGMLPGWAEETAKQRTFQNEGAIAEAMVGLRSAANKLSIKDKQGGSIGVGDVMLPFARVPGNLVAQAANYSPLGIANGLREITNVMVEAKKGNYSAEAQAQAARNFGRGVTGTGLLAGFAALAAKGLIDVAGADDKDKEALEKAQGRTGTQWNLSATMRAFNGESTEWQDGDTLMSIGFLDPINSIMAASALISDAYAEDNNLTIGEIANASFSSLVQSILDLPAMSSISSLIDAYTYAEGETAGEKAANAALDYAGSQASSFLLPNALKGVASGLDDTVRNQYTGETIGEGVVDSLKYGIPGLRETLPASLDPFGREKTQTGDDVLNMLNNNLLPGAITKYSETKVEGALEDLYDQTGVSGIYPNKSAPTSITIDKNKVQLDADQQATYQRTAGQTAEEIMSDMMDTKTFRNASDSEKAEYLELANKYARSVAAGEATNGKYEADKYVELAQTAKKELGLTEAEYLMLYQDYGGTIMNGDKLREAYDAGIKVQDYLDYYTTASKYDADKNGSYTIVERGTSILQSGLSDENQQALWSMYYPEWKDKATDVGVSYETYIDYKYITNKAGASKKADKIAALQAAGYSYNEAVNLYTKIK